MRKLVPILFMLLALLGGACGPDDPSLEAPQGSGDGNHEMDMQDDDFDFGQPGGSSPAGREIPISALDGLRFDPDVIEVSSGETVKFVVRNDGKNSHEFVIGDEAYQEEHAEEMAGDHEMNEDSNLVDVEPGKIKEIKWTFTDEGEVLFACQEPGHYEGGMVGTIEVSS